MKILYIAPFRDFSGYATAARGYLRALHMAGVDVVARPVRYDRADPGTGYKPTELEAELLKKPIGDVDVIIQHVTPNEMRMPDAIRGKVNIAVVASETSRIPDYWAKKLNQFDAAITFCETSVQAFKDSGVTVPVYKVPHCFDLASYDLSAFGGGPDIDPLKPDGAEQFMDGRFLFYNISQFSHKKGLDVLIQAYYAAFWDKADKVALILKTYVNMVSPDRSQEREYVAQYIGQIRSSMRLPSYPPIILITDTMTEKDIVRLHATGDCYVCSSRAEGWCIPAFEGLAYGNKLVTTDWGGMGEFTRTTNEEFCLAPRDNVFLVDYSLEPLVGQQHHDPDLYTARDFVAEPKVSSMMGAMMKAYETERKLPQDQPYSTAHLQEFGYEAVGPQMFTVIQEVVSKKEVEHV